MSSFTYQDVLAYFGIGGAHPGGLALTKEIIRSLPISKSSNVLDVGCGTGQTSAYLGSRCKVTALDLHPLMIKKARERFKKEKVSVNLIRGSAEQVPLRSNSFDFIIAESLTVFTNIEKTLQEYYRLLKQGGILVDLDMTATTSFTVTEIQDFKKVYGISRVPKKEEWVSDFKKAGFTSIEIMKEEIISSTLQNQPASTDQMPQFNPSEKINSKLFGILNDHQKLTENYSHRLKYTVFKLRK
jgi:SAM-dependent methyltransferase